MTKSYLTNITSSRDKVCVTNSLQSNNIDGTYDFLYFNTTLNGAVYYNSNKNKYLYPFIESQTLNKYIIKTEGDDVGDSYCDINTAMFDINDCIKGWKTWINNEWTDDINERVINCNKVCVINNNQGWVDGTYSWNQFNLITNSSVYICGECDNGKDTYLHAKPLEDRWLIGTLNSRYSKCNLTNPYRESPDIITLNDCGEWSTWDQSPSKQYLPDLDVKVTKYECELDIFDNEFINETSQNDTICITGSLRSDIDGKYKYLYFNSTLNGPVYYNENNTKYIHPYISSTRSIYQYLVQSLSSIGTNISNSYCNIDNPPIGYIFDPDDCYKDWKTDVNGIWTDDVNQRLIICNDVCMIGNTVRSHLDGTYIWHHFDLTKDSSVYYCYECWDYYNGMYIYAWPTQSRFWFGSDYTKTNHWGYCTFSRLAPIATDRISLLNHCSAWFMWDGISKYKLETDIKFLNYPCPTPSPTNNPSLSPSNPTIHPTISPTYNPSISPTNPTNNPTRSPTNIPTKDPTTKPSRSPLTFGSTYDPTMKPTLNPTNQPTQIPTCQPTTFPTTIPTTIPTILPTLYPSLFPTTFPTTSFPTTSFPTTFPTTTFPTTSFPTTSFPTTFPLSLTADPTADPTPVDEYGDHDIDVTVSKRDKDIDSTDDNKNDDQLILISIIVGISLLCISGTVWILYNRKRRKTTTKSAAMEITASGAVINKAGTKIGNNDDAEIMNVINQIDIADNIEENANNKNVQEIQEEIKENKSMPKNGDLIEFLTNCDLEKYSKLLTLQEVHDINDFIDLDDDDIKELALSVGMKKLHQKQFIKAIKELQLKQQIIIKYNDNDNDNDNDNEGDKNKTKLYLDWVQDSERL